MTVTAKTTRVQYTGTGLVKTYAYNWKILDDADLVAIRTTDAGVDSTLVLNTDYTVTGAGDDSGGSVILASNLSSGYLLTIYMEMDIDQPTDLTNQQSPFLERIEAMVDRQTLISQQLQTELGLCVQFPPSSTEDPTTIVAVVNQAVTDAQTAQGLSEDARDAAVVAQGLAEDAQAAAESAAQNISAQKYTATATAAQTVITPGFTWDDGAGNLVLYIDGLKQATTTYTLTSPTITLSEALDGGETIEVYSIDFTAAPGDPLLPENNLSDLNNAATARANLGLGTAAVVDTGTAEGDVPVLGAGGKLPSGVMPMVEDLTARDNAAMNAFLTWLDIDRATGSVPRGALWTFKTDELPTKTNAVYSANAAPVGNYYTNTGGASGTTPATSFALGTGYTRVSREFAIPNGSVVAELGLHASAAFSGTMYIVERTAANTYTMKASVAFSHTGSGFEYFALASTYTIPASGTFYVAMYTAAGPTILTSTSIAGSYKTGALTLNTSTAGFTEYANTTNTPVMAYRTAPTNMTIYGGPASLGYVPTKATVYILHKAVDAVTLNIDVKVRASRGATYTDATDLTTLCQYNSEYKLLRATVDLSAQASGSNGYWGVETFNNKAQRVRGAILWAE